MLAVQGAELTAAYGELEQALNTHLIAQLLVGPDQDGFDLVARCGRGLDRAVSCDRQCTQGFHGSLAVLGDCRCLSCEDCSGSGFGVVRVALALASSVRAVGAVDFEDGDAGALQ